MSSCVQFVLQERGVRADWLYGCASIFLWLSPWLLIEMATCKVKDIHLTCKWKLYAIDMGLLNLLYKIW